MEEASCAMSKGDIFSSVFGQATFSHAPITNWTLGRESFCARHFVAILDQKWRHASCWLAAPFSHVTCGHSGSGGARGGDSSQPKNCRVSHVRRSRLPHRPANFTLFNDRTSAASVMDRSPETYMALRGATNSPTEALQVERRAER